MKDLIPAWLQTLPGCKPCVAHRLALACGQAADEIMFLKKFESILDHLDRFYQKSAVEWLV